MSIPTSQPVRLSERQEAFIRVLLDEREVPDDKRAVIGDPHTLDKQAATKVIDYLTGLPKKIMVKATTAIPGYSPAPSASTGFHVNKPPAITSEGMYQNGTNIYRVQRSKGTGRLYAELLTPSGSFVYAKGAIYDLKPEHRMTVEQAKAYGLKFGRCCVCGKTLTDPVSMAAGIGPVCVKGKYFTSMNTPAAPVVGPTVNP